MSALAACKVGTSVFLMSMMNKRDSGCGDAHGGRKIEMSIDAKKQT